MKLARIIACVALLGLSGCARGLFFTYTTEPLTTNFNRTLIVDQKVSGSVKTLQYNNYRIDWGTMAIGEIAQRAGLDEAYYADVTTMTILGIWTQRWVHVYGNHTSGVSTP